jgi:protein PhnA
MFNSSRINEYKNKALKIMNEIPQCPKCGSEFTYFDGSLYVCPDCSHEFNSLDEDQEAADVAKDSNGAELFDGDAVTVIKDLKVKGSSMVIKRGTKVKSIRLTENPEEVDCKIDGSSIVLKTCFLKK